MNTMHCPICGREMPAAGPDDWPERPFCSSRCRLIDLGRWLGEDYRLPANPAGMDDLDDPESAEVVTSDPPKPAVPSVVPNREEA